MVPERGGARNPRGDAILASMTKLPLALALAAGACAAQAATLTATITDTGGAPLENAVAWAIPRAAAAKAPRAATIEQVDRAFRPLVSIVQVGAQVSFPNRDDTRHHVYSFSPAKPFEIKLYAGAATAPSITFDKAGEVVLGCNIHDNMVGYVYVVDTPFFGKAGADGRVRLEGMPAGEYEVRAAYFGQAAPMDAKPVKLESSDSRDVDFAAVLKPRVRGR